MTSLREPSQEAERIVRAAEKKHLVLRLLGGVGYYFRCPSMNDPFLKREYADLDFVGHSKQSGDVVKLFQELDYTPRERFNAVHGSRRLIFDNAANGMRSDIFLDVFEMCHKFNFKERLEIDRYTLSLADLLATKLQIVEINEKDLKDLLGIFLDHEIGTADSPEVINGAYLAEICAGDWSVDKTFTINLDKVLSYAESSQLDQDRRLRISARINQLLEMIEKAPKSAAWKIRNSVGERVRWYELPETEVMANSGLQAAVVDQRK